MSKIKKIFFRVLPTLLLVFVLAVPGFALDTVDYVDYAYIQINSDALIYSTGTLPLGFYDEAESVSSYALYVPLDAVAKQISVNLNLVSGPVSSYGTFSASYGYLRGSTFTQVGSLPVPSRLAAPQASYGNSRYKIGSFLSVDTSSIDSVGENYFVKILCSGCDFKMYPTIEGQTGRTGETYNTVYWSTALGFYITASGMTGFSSTGTTSGSNYVKAIKQTNGYISTQNETSSPVKVHLKSAALYGNIAYGVSFSVTRASDDSTAVAELVKANEYLDTIETNTTSIKSNVSTIRSTLTGMAANLQTITDDFKAREDVGTDISGVTTDDQISSGTSGISTGSSSLSSAISSLPSFSSIIAPSTGFISFLTSPVQQIFSFGNGYLLYIATAMVLLSVIFWIIKRMGGDN